MSVCATCMFCIEIDFMPVIVLVPREKSSHIIACKKANELECLACQVILCIMCLGGNKNFLEIKAVSFPFNAFCTTSWSCTQQLSALLSNLFNASFSFDCTFTFLYYRLI
jgi:hypothetical protein